VVHSTFRFYHLLLSMDFDCIPAPRPLFNQRITPSQLVVITFAACPASFLEVSDCPLLGKGLPIMRCCDIWDSASLSCTVFLPHCVFFIVVTSSSWDTFSYFFLRSFIARSRKVESSPFLLFFHNFLNAQGRNQSGTPSFLHLTRRVLLLTIQPSQTCDALSLESLLRHFPREHAQIPDCRGLLHFLLRAGFLPFFFFILNFILFLFGSTRFPLSRR